MWGVRDKIRDFLDQIFSVPKTFLDLAIQKVQNASFITRQGLDVNSYLGIFGDMPMMWQLVLSSLLLMAVTLSSLLILRTAIRLYFAVKEGVKWW